MELRLQHLRTFVAVAEQRHFGRAARSLGIPQPSASRHIHDLETELGVALFARTSRSTTLTAAGSAVLDHAYAVLDRAERLRAAAEIAARRTRGEVAVGFVTSTVNAFLTPLVQRLAADHPEVEVRVSQLRTRHLVEQVRGRAIDVAVARDPRLSEGDVIALPVGVEAVTVAVTPDHRFAGRETIALTDLRDEPLVTLDPGIWPPGHEAWMAHLRGCGVEPRIVSHAPSYQSAVALAAAGAGAYMLPASAAILRDDVRYVDVTGVRSQIVLVRRAEPPSLAVAAVIDAATAVADTLAPPPQASEDAVSTRSGAPPRKPRMSSTASP